mmetsp:Transcript_15206/g.28863  ORF Transcript_15206/g.28863 Transcript_15206/m.28863 type:complete len:226 (+) Transcript_15206:73-750(+)
MVSLLLQGCKLTYFGIAGRGESIRLALAIAGIEEWTDNRVEFADWSTVKPNTPWGSLPVLALQDGREIAQQRAILRLVGKETGLYPDDSFAAAKIDELMDALEDVGSKTNGIGQGLPQEEKEAERKKACEVGGVTYEILGRIDNFVATYGKDGHAVGDKLTIADLLLYTTSCNLVGGLYDGVPADACDAFENITACRKLVRSHPAVNKWYDELKSPIWPSYAALF